jgi:hypothetical protein
MIVLALSLGALLAAPGPGGPSLRPRVVVFSPQAPAQQGAFRASKILDIEVGALFPRRLAGPHVAEFKLYTPTGNLYQTLTVPFTGDPGNPRRPGTRRVRGYPRPLQVQEMRLAGGQGYFVTGRLPVAGTWITTNSLYGGWRVDVHIDGDRQPAGRAGFRIQP